LWPVVVVQAFLNGELQIPADEAFVNAVQSYFEEFLKSDRVVALVSSGGSSANDFREVSRRYRLQFLNLFLLSKYCIFQYFEY